MYVWKNQKMHHFAYIVSNEATCTVHYNTATVSTHETKQYF